MPTLPTIDIAVEDDNWTAACRDVEEVVARGVRAALTARADLTAGVAAVVVDVTLTDDAEQRELNRQYRGQDTSTNVLSFPGAGPDTELPPGAPLLLGDIVLAYGTVIREAAEQRKPFADHLSHLVVHGTLHLLGFDHENDSDAEIMEALETEILAALGMADPYRVPI